MSGSSYFAIYDFTRQGHGLADVLIWNVRTAQRCREARRSRVDVNLCFRSRAASNSRIAASVRLDGRGLSFNELFPALSTHPLLGTIRIFFGAEAMVAALRRLAEGDPLNAEVVAAHEHLSLLDAAEKMSSGPRPSVLAELATFGADLTVPALNTSSGCEPDVNGLLLGPLAGKRVVILDALPGASSVDQGPPSEVSAGNGTWLEFVGLAGRRHPEVQFVVTGRLQAVPLRLLHQPNVTSLRTLGLGLGHELTLALNADLFIGGMDYHAAMAAFSSTPYFLLSGADNSTAGVGEPPNRLAFAAANQTLVSTPCDSSMLMNLLEEGLALPKRHPSSPVARSCGVNVRGFERERAAWLQPSATTVRFFVDDDYADQETGFLLWPRMQRGFIALSRGDTGAALDLVARVRKNFPRLVSRVPELQQLQAGKLPSPRLRFSDTARNYLLSRIDGNILPRALRQTPIHAMGRRMKDLVLGYRRR